jgi:hypothetical protein
LEVTDKISVSIQSLPFIEESLAEQADYIASQVLARSVTTAPQATGEFTQQAEIDEQTVEIAITKL